MTSLNWKSRGDGRYDALASREVGGKYFIEWVERYYSDYSCELVECRRFRVDYQTKGGGGIGNVDNVSIRTLGQAKQLAELHHAKRRSLIRKYGAYRDVPSDAWGQLNRELLAYQQGLPSTSISADPDEKQQCSPSTARR
jgi:hypothetical protein